MLGRLGLVEPSKTSPDTVFRALSMVTDAMLEEDEQASVTGYVMIGDNKNMLLSHLCLFPPPLAKKAMVLWQVRWTRFLRTRRLRTHIDILTKVW